MAFYFTCTLVDFDNVAVDSIHCKVVWVDFVDVNDGMTIEWNEFADIVLRRKYASDSSVLSAWGTHNYSHPYYNYKSNID